MTNVKEGPGTPEEPKSEPKQAQTIEGPIGNIADISIKATGGAKSRARALTISTTKPSQQTFYSCCPQEDMTTDIFGLEVEVEGTTSKQLYPVMPNVVYKGKFELELLRDCHEIRITPFVTRKHRLGLWCLKLNSMKWSTTGQEALAVAKSGWIRLIPDMSQGWYELEEPLAEWDPPNWEKLLTGRSLKDLMNLGFKDRIITSESHQVIVDLYGSE